MSFICASRLPPWQDVVMMESQQANLFDAPPEAPAAAPAAGPRQLASSAGYAMFARADEGVRAIGEWLDRAGYAVMWRRRLGPAAAAAAAGWEPWPLERLLDRRARHVASCALCQRAEARAARAGAALKAVVAALGAAALLAAAVAAGMVAAAQGGAAAGAAAANSWAAGAALCGAAAAGAATARAKLLEWAEYNFVSGVRRWRARGGLSLVPPGGGPVLL
jgi:hypothetical protein